MLLRNRLLQLIVIVLSPATALLAEDASNCSAATVHGSYGMLGTGTLPGFGDFAAVGRLVYDGKGNLAGKLYLRVAGNNFGPFEFTGTYSVSPDCTMKDKWSDGATHTSVIVDQGKHFFLVNDTPGSGETASGHAIRQ